MNVTAFDFAAHGHTVRLFDPPALDTSHWTVSVERPPA